MAIDDKKTLFEDFEEGLMLDEGRIAFNPKIAFSTLCGLIEKRIEDAKEEVIQSLKRGIPPL